MLRTVVVTAVVLLSLIAIPAQSPAQDDTAVVQCVDETVRATVYRERVCTVVSVRAEPPRHRTVTIRARQEGCLTSTPGHRFIGAANIEQMDCWDGRCRHEPPELIRDAENEVEHMCLAAHAWSNKGPFTAGGYAAYRMCIDVERQATVHEMMEILQKCAASR